MISILKMKNTSMKMIFNKEDLDKILTQPQKEDFAHISKVFFFALY